MDAIEVKTPPRDVRAPALTIVIPALDEEGAIGSIVERCLAARPEIRRVAGLESVEIIVVSDGSTDRTAEIARSFDEIRVIEFERNRGYGAAIKAGFAAGTGTLVGFLDADGTCDPRQFAEMCRRLQADRADVVLGSRLGPGSKMPRTRRLGNRLFALLLGFLCGRRVTDTASGMRVVDRRALDLLEPLPDGLHFTPSMSARALLNDLRVIEIPMPYEERIGESKLRAFRDGVRFLRTIIDGVLCYQPERPFLIGFTACLVIGLCLAAYPVEFYLTHGRVEEWMIYRFLVCLLFGTVGHLLLAGAAVANRLAAGGPRRAPATFWSSIGVKLFEGRTVLVFAGIFAVSAVALLWPGIVEYLGTGAVTLHWSRVVTGIFGFILVAQAVIAVVALRVVGIRQTQLDAVTSRSAAPLPVLGTPTPFTSDGTPTPAPGVPLPSRSCQEDLEPCPS